MQPFNPNDDVSQYTAQPQIVEEDKEEEQSRSSAVPQDEAKPLRAALDPQPGPPLAFAVEDLYAGEFKVESSPKKRLKSRKADQPAAAVAGDTIIITQLPNGRNIYSSQEQVQVGVPFQCNEWAGMPDYGNTEFRPKQKIPGGSYKGNWALGQKARQGPGTLEDPSTGALYEGWWMNDKKEGMGKMTYKNKEVYYGLWSRDQKTSGM